MQSSFRPSTLISLKRCHVQNVDGVPETRVLIVSKQLWLEIQGRARLAARARRHLGDVARSPPEPSNGR